LFDGDNYLINEEIDSIKHEKLKDKMEKVTGRVDGDPEFTEDVTRLLDQGASNQRENLSIRVVDTTRSVFSSERDEEEEAKRK